MIISSVRQYHNVCGTYVSYSIRLAILRGRRFRRWTSTCSGQTGHRAACTNRHILPHNNSRHMLPECRTGSMCFAESRGDLRSIPSPRPAPVELITVILAHLKMRNYAQLIN